VPTRRTVGGKARGLSKRRVRTPLVLQMEAVECGAACLGMVLGYFGKFVSLDILRVDCGVSRDGSNAANLLKVAQQYGCTAKGFRKTDSDVLKGPFPAILFWNFNHFVVLEGASKSAAYLNDPAVGRRSVPLSEFEKSFTGIVLSVEPGENFEHGGKPPRPMVQLLRQAAAFRVQLFFVLLIGFLIAIPGFAVPNFAGIFVDGILLENQRSWFRPLVAAIAASVIAMTILSWIKSAVLLRVAADMTSWRSADFLWYVLRLPPGFFALRYLGDIANRVTSVQRIAQLISGQIGFAVFKLFTALILFALMFILEPVLAMVAIGGALINVLVLKVLHRVRFETSVRLSVEEGKLFGTSFIGIKTIETLKASAREDDFFGKWAGYHARTILSEQLLARLDQLSALVPAVIITMTMAAALWIGGARVLESALTLGAFIAFQALFSAVSAPVQLMVDTVGQSQQVAADLTRLNDVLNHPLDWRHAKPPTAGPITKTEAVSLRLENLSFGYNPLAPALIDGFDLKITPGGWTALVGATGSGKSTIGKLASGLYQPWGGRVLIDGKDITTIDRFELAQLIGAVDQEIALFEGSFRDNLTLWDPTVPQEALISAARSAQIFDLISSTAESFAGQVEENGRNFSGGERQRIEIARALVRSPALLILDEATSALDPATELNIMQALRARGMSCLVVAHRLSTIRDCDEIIVLDRGQVVERGTHDELMARDGEYSRLIREGKS